MLLNSETAIKVAHDVIHDSEEFFTKWSRLAASAEEVPEGYVDFEFADGALLRIPCVWQIMLFAEGAKRPSIIFRHNGYTVEWKPGTMGTASVGAVSGLISDGPIKAGNLTLGSIVSQNDWIQIVDAVIEYFNSTVAVVRNGSINKIAVADAATMTGCTFDTLMPEGNGFIDAELNDARIDNVDADTLITRGEIFDPVLKMNAYDSKGERLYSPLPKTDAKYDMYIPFFPFDANAHPINGFDAPLVDNPFYPDWFYVCDSPCPWRPATVWVPSHAKPSEPCWQDEDGLYWHEAKVTSDASKYGSPRMIYPPRCREGDSNSTLPPVKKAADGIVVTVKFLEGISLPVCVRDTYTKQSDGTWYWYPGLTRQTKGPCILQYVLKRKFTETNGEITAFEYQFLPLGDSNGVLV
jgi:hypothetical protein